MLDPTVLRGAEEFNAVYNKGQSTASRHIVVFYKRNDLGFDRKGFVASKKVGNAVRRNRARRLMKESVRTIKFPATEGHDIIFVARKSINGQGLDDVTASIKTAIKKAGLV